MNGAHGDDLGPRRIREHPVLGTLDHAKTVRIMVDGRELAAIDGEPIMAAMLAHGLRVARTLPDTGSPRGLFCGVGRCPDCAMMVDGESNVMTCVTPVRDGMVVETQPGLGRWKMEA